MVAVEGVFSTTVPSDSPSSAAKKEGEKSSKSNSDAPMIIASIILLKSLGRVTKFAARISVASTSHIQTRAKI